jgi:hypothetical protein
MPGNPLTDPNWAADLADSVERVVGTVRDRVARPVVTASRAIVFGTFIAIVGSVAGVLALLVLTRLFQDLLDIGLPRERAVYISYFAVGGIMCLVGWLLTRKQTSESR